MAGEDQERFEDYLELERYIEELQAGHVAHPPKDMTPSQARIYRMAALFRSASPDAAGPRPEFAEQLKAQLLAQSSVADDDDAPTVPRHPVVRAQLIAPATPVAPSTPVKNPKPVRFVSRRSLLTGGAAVAASLVVGAGAERLLGQPLATGRVDPDGFTPAPITTRIALEGETTWLPVATVAALGGSAVSFFLNGIVGYVIRDTTSQQIIAMSAACTHLGCIVEWQDTDRHFHCPCHGAMFTADGQGENHAGYRYDLPPLPRLNTKIENGKVYVEVPAKKK